MTHQSIFICWFCFWSKHISCVFCLFSKVFKHYPRFSHSSIQFCICGFIWMDSRFKMYSMMKITKTTYTHTHRAVSWIMIFNQLPFTAVIDNYMEHVVVSTCINGHYAQQGNYEIIIAWGLCISPKNARTYIRMFRFGGIEIEWILDFLFHQYAQKKIELKRIYTSFHWYPLLGWAKKCPI